MKSIFANEVKATTRRVVLNAFNKFADPLIAKGEDITAYTLPADMWDFEQSIAAKFVNPAVHSHFDLTCFECKWKTYKRNKNSRSFMLHGNELHDNLSFDYKYDYMHSNRRAKKNFFMWADFCGLPDVAKMPVVLNEKNYVDNSMLFVTFACRWRVGEIHPNLLNLHQLIKQQMQASADSHAATYAVRSYMLDQLPKSFRLITAIEYIATSGAGATPMMLLGFTNAQHVKCDELILQLNYPKNREECLTRRRDYYINKEACLSW